ncbi:MAG: copper resistance protein B [Alphaproteobacteria bacterium]|nr:copper resistance protein B [Alphaproteobacteria bacterium]
MNRVLPIMTSLMAAATTSAALAAGVHSKNDPMEEPVLFWGAGVEIDGADNNWFERSDGALINWNAYAWIGGDNVKVRLEAEGEVLDGDVESSEVRALVSWNIATFWDLQAGVRYDTDPRGLGWAVVGVQGLAPYFFETDARVFLSEDGDAALRVGQTFDLLLTQRLVLQPHVEANAYAQDIPELGVGAGLADVEAGLQLRYEFDRKFAHYVDVVYDRKLGETSQIARAAGEDPEAFSVRFGLRIRL